MRQGADVDALEALGREMAACAGTIEDALGRLSSMLARTPWTGPDADAFRRVWNGPVRSELLQSSAGLRDAGTEVRRQADDQRRASDGAGPGSNAGRVAWLGPPPGAVPPPTPVVPGDAAAAVATARSLGSGVVPGDRGPAPDVPLDTVLDGAVSSLGPGAHASGLLADQPPGRWALTAPSHPGAMVAGVVATQPWDGPVDLAGWDATSVPTGAVAGDGAAPAATASVASAEPAWRVLGRSAGAVADVDEVVAGLW